MYVPKIFLAFIMVVVAGVLPSSDQQPKVLGPSPHRTKAKTMSARLRRFLKAHGRELVALTAGAAVGGLGAGFAAHYYDSKKLKKNDDMHAQALEQLNVQQAKDKDALTQRFMKSIEEIQSGHRSSLVEKDAALKKAADDYQQALNSKDEANVAEIERLRATFETESRNAQAEMTAKITELEEALETRNREQAEQLDQYTNRQKELLGTYQEEQMAKLTELRSDFAVSSRAAAAQAAEMQEAFASSDVRQQELLTTSLGEYVVKQQEVLAAIAASKEQLQADFAQHMGGLRQGFIEAYDQLNSRLNQLHYLSSIGIWQANAQAQQVAQQLQALEQNQKKAEGDAVALHQKQIAQLAQMQQQAQQQQAALAELGEEGRTARVADRMAVFKRDQKEIDPSVVKQKDAAVASIRDGFTKRSDYEKSGLTGGYRPATADFKAPLSSSWQLQRDGTYKKGSRLTDAAAPALPVQQRLALTDAPRPVSFPADQARRLADEQKEALVRAQMAARREAVLGDPRLRQSSSAPTTALTLRTGAARHTSGQPGAYPDRRQLLLSN